jgi:DNA-binding response OmpR family regulator
MATQARVCLIDDDVVVLEAIAAGLRDTGYQVLTAPGAAAGLDLAARGGVDVIVTDMNMPGTSGAQLIAEARAKWPRMPIVAISGASAVGGVSVQDAARALGADALLQKPFRARALHEVLQGLLVRSDPPIP